MKFDLASQVVVEQYHAPRTAHVREVIWRVPEDEWLHQSLARAAKREPYSCETFEVRDASCYRFAVTFHDGIMFVGHGIEPW